MINEKEVKVYHVLDELGINYTRYEHVAVYTVDDVNKLDMEIEGQHCKNLFIRNSKGNQHYLAVLPDDKKVSLKDLASKIGSTPLSFASEKRLLKYLGLTPGSVSPFGLINDVNKHVIVLLDEDFKDVDYISFHPNINTATLKISYEDFEKYLKWCGNETHYIHV